MSIPYHITTEASVERAVDLLLREASDLGAAELFLEPHLEGARVRLRRDGLLHDFFRYSSQAHVRFLARLKGLSRLREDAGLAAQRGRLRRALAHVDVEGTLALVPIPEGEKALLRLRTPRPGFATLGLSEAQRARLQGFCSEKNGLLLVAGPRRSGLTTTLYALLETAARTREGIACLEEDIEHDLSGVEQEVVDPALGRTWPACLRELVARGAAVIGLGALRDEESAAIAVSAAAHRLVIAVVEARDVSDALRALLDLRIEPRVAAGVLRGVLLERLARRVCPDCRRDDTWRRQKVARGGKCEACLFTGHRGQIGVFALHDLTRASKKRPTLLEDAQEKVRSGAIAPEELERL